MQEEQQIAQSKSENQTGNVSSANQVGPAANTGTTKPTGGNTTPSTGNTTTPSTGNVSTTTPSTGNTGTATPTTGNTGTTTKPSTGNSSNTSKPDNASAGQKIANKGCEYIGNPYVYGGNSLTNGIDCSGFTQQIYAAFGVSLPRVDSAQALCGVEIPLSQAKAGDLLCYYGHVGIYNGSGGIIHASSPGVGIVEFSNCQYRTLRCVRRVL